MKRHDLLLIVAGVCLVVSAGMVAPALALLVAGVAFGALWFLLGDA